MKSRIFALLLGGAMLLSLSACTVSDDEDAPDTSTSPRQSESTAPSPTPPAGADPAMPSSDASVGSELIPIPPTTPAKLESSGMLGDYTVEIKDFSLTKDVTKKPAIIITYTFTNSSEKATSALSALNGAAYQNGVQLTSPTIMDSKVYDAGSSRLDVKPGGTLDIQRAYSLNSETAPVEFELSELFSFSDELLGKTFEIAPGGVTELASIDVPPDAVTGIIGDFEVSIISLTKAKDYKGKDCVTAVYGFKNNSSEPASFSTSCSSKVYQDSIQLESAVTSATSLNDALAVLDNVFSSLTNVKPGAAILVSASYLTTSTSEVEVEVTPLFHFGDDMVARTFSLN